MSELKDFPRLHCAVRMLGLDIGANVISSEIPVEWLHRATLAEEELSKLTRQEMEFLVYGEAGEREALVDRCENADRFLEDTFDGDLGEKFFKNWENMYDARKAEAAFAQDYKDMI